MKEEHDVIPPEVAAIIPYSQLQVTKENLDAFRKPIERLKEQLEKCPKIGSTENKDEHPAMFHYFCGGATDIYICEYDPEDRLMFGYNILNGDLDNSEWGYTSLEEILPIAIMNIDYYFDEQSIEAALYKKYPTYFKKPASLEIA
jgi:hypothetical protein